MCCPRCLCSREDKNVFVNELKNVTIVLFLCGVLNPVWHKALTTCSLFTTKHHLCNFYQEVKPIQAVYLTGVCGKFHI